MSWVCSITLILRKLWKNYFPLPQLDFLFLVGKARVRVPHCAKGLNFLRLDSKSWSGVYYLAWIEGIRRMLFTGLKNPYFYNSTDLRLIRLNWILKVTRSIQIKLKKANWHWGFRLTSSHHRKRGRYYSSSDGNAKRTRKESNYMFMGRTWNRP